MHLFELCPNLDTVPLFVEHLGNRIVTPDDAISIHQWIAQPLPQQSPAHGGAGLIEHIEERSLTASGLQIGRQFEIATRALIHPRIAAETIGFDTGKMLNRLFLGLLEVMHESTSSTNAGFQVLASETLQRQGVKQVQQLFARPGVRKHFFIQCRQ